MGRKRRFGNPFGSLSEVLMTESLMVLVPQFGDQFINARLTGGALRVN